LYGEMRIITKTSVTVHCGPHITATKYRSCACVGAPTVTPSCSPLPPSTFNSQRRKWGHRLVFTTGSWCYSTEPSQALRHFLLHLCNSCVNMRFIIVTIQFQVNIPTNSSVST
jgi:hypothetical protein